MDSKLEMNIMKVMKNILSHSFFAAIIYLFMGAFSSGFAASKLEDYSFKNDGNISQLTMVFSDIVEYKSFQLENPARFVLDVENSVWAVKNTLSSDKDSRLVSRVRHGVQGGSDVRIVLDLKGEIKVLDKYFILPGKKSKKYKLVFKLAAKDAVIASRKTGKNRPESMKNDYSYNSKLPFSVPSFKPKTISGKAQKSPISIAKPVYKKPRKPVIVLDAGHGGIDPGAIGKSGMKEKKITLEYARNLKKELEKTGLYKVHLTRSSDQYINLNSRVEKARRVNADLFISLHADSHPNKKTRGLSVYTLSEKRARREAKRLINKSKKREVLRDVNLKNESEDVKNMLIDLAQKQTKRTSSDFAEILVEELGDEARLLKNTHRSASFMVLTSVEVPSVLVELGYMSNRFEEKLLRTRQYRVRLVKSMKDAVIRYFKKNPA